MLNWSCFISHTLTLVTPQMMSWDM
jgi:hypothetical protein